MASHQQRRTQIMNTWWAAGQVATNKYRARLTELVKPGMTILHAGCGWDKNGISRPFKEVCKVIGVDLDPRVESMFHSEFHLASLEKMPFPPASFDLIFCEYVFEHLTEPEKAMGELKRVLKPGGTILILTPNLFSYKTLAAHLTPQSFHVRMGQHRYGRGHEADMYPTVYRCNTAHAFRHIAAKTGLRVRKIEFITNGPTWFERIPGLFGVFHWFHLALKRWTALSHVRCAMVVELTSG